MLTRGFYALQSNWAPTLVALGSLLLNVALDVVLYRVGVWGLPLATSISNVIGVAALLVLLARRTGLDHPRATAWAIVRILALSLVATAAAWGAWRGLDELLGQGTAGQIVSVGSGLAVGTVAFLGLAPALRVREVQALRALLPGRRGGDDVTGGDADPT